MRLLVIEDEGDLAEAIARGLRQAGYAVDVAFDGKQELELASFNDYDLLVLADEPTGNLDSHTSLQIIAILQELNARGLTVVLVTHETDITGYCQRQVKFRDGKVVDDMLNVTPASAREQLGPRTVGDPMLLG